MKYRSLWITAAMVASMMLAVAPAKAEPPPGAIDLGTLAITQLIARHSGKCVTVHGYSTGNGAAVDQYTCVGQQNQRWNKLSDGGYLTNYFIAEHSGKCLDVQGGGKSNGTKLIQWECNSRNNQRFFAFNKGNGYWEIKPAHAETKCLDIPGSSQSNNVQLVIWGCNGNANQQFRLA